MYLKEERLTKGTYHKDTTLRVLSLGAGVQSSTVLVMMLNGEIQPADVCIFADTGNEPKEVYEHLKYLKQISTIPIRITDNGHIIKDIEERKFDNFIKIPLYQRDKNGKVGIGRRQCTNHYKIKPIHSEIRRVLGRQRLRYTSIEIVMGISYDEIQRMAYPEKEWAIHCYPLVANQITRQDCLDYLKKHDYPLPPRSSCIVCPYRTDTDWLTMKVNKYAEFEKAVEFDNFVRDMNGETKNYVSRHAIPLELVDFKAGRNQDQELIDIECEGYCGL